MKKLNEIKQIIMLDKKNNSYKSYIILKNYRIGNYLFNKGKKSRINQFIFKAFCFKHELINTLLNINAQISYAATLGKNIKLPHSGDGVVISSKTVIGDNVTIFHQVTLGVNEAKDKECQKIIIGNNVMISTGAKIISCVIGDNCRIGANTVVVSDLPPNSLCYSQATVKTEYYVDKL